MKMIAFCHDKKLITALLKVQILGLCLLRNPQEMFTLYQKASALE